MLSRDSSPLGNCRDADMPTFVVGFDKPGDDSRPTECFDDDFGIHRQKLTHSQLKVNRQLTNQSVASIMIAGMTPASDDLTQEQKIAMGRRIRESIAIAKKNQTWLAAQLECSKAHVSKMCKTGSVSLGTLARICQLLGSSLDYIVLGKIQPADTKFIHDLRMLMDSAELAGNPAKK